MLLPDLDQRVARCRRAACGLMADKHLCAADTRMGKLFVAPDNLKPLPHDAVEAAITQVLEAEADARTAVVGARGEATQIAEQAREQARRLSVHTDRRIHRVRAAFTAKLTAEVAALEAEAAALGAEHELTPAEAARVDMAVVALAREMTESAT